MDIREALTQAVDKVEKEQETSVETTNVDASAGSTVDAPVTDTATKTETSPTTGSGDAGEKSVAAGDADGGTSGGNEGKLASDTATGDKTGEAAKPDVGTKADTATKEDNSADSGSGRFRVDRPPQSWKGAAREAWNDLPVATRQEVIRRERAFDSAMRESATAREFATGFQKLIEPYRDRLVSQGGGNEINAIKSLMEADRILHTGTQQQKAKAIASFVSSYGVSIEELDKALSADPGAAIAGSPIVDTIRREIGQSLAPINQYINQQRAPVQRQPAPEHDLEQELLSMANDPAKYEFLNDVLDDMADIMEGHARRGVALTAAQAYSKAIKIHPDIGPQIEAREAEAHKRAIAKQLDEQAKKAKGASVSVSGAPLGKPTTQISGNPGDLRGTLLAAISQVENGQGRI